MKSIIINQEIGRVLDSRYRLMLNRVHEFVMALMPELRTQQAHETLIQLDNDMLNIAHTIDTWLGAEDALTHLQVISLIVELESYFSVRGLWEINLHWALALLEKSAHIAPHLTHVLFNLIGTAYREMGNYEKAVELYTLAIRYADLAGTPDLTRIYGNLGLACWRLGRLDEALVYMRRVWKAEKEAGHLYETATALASLAEIHLEFGDAEGGMLAAFDALKLAQELGNPILQAEMMALNAKHMMANGLLQEAVPVYKMALSLLEKVGNHPALGLTLLNFGILQHQRNNDAEAIQLVQSSLLIFEHFGMAEEIDQARTLLNHLSADSTNPPTDR